MDYFRLNEVASFQPVTLYLLVKDTLLIHLENSTIDIFLASNDHEQVMSFVEYSVYEIFIPNIYRTTLYYQTLVDYRPASLTLSYQP